MKDFNITMCYDKDDKNPIIINGEDRFLGTLINGPTGSGKSAQIMIPMIFQDLHKDVGITFFDPKEETFNKIKSLIDVLNSSKETKLNRNIIFVDPSDKNCPKLNFLSGEENLIVNNLFKLLIDSNMESNIKESSRLLISNTISLFRKYKTTFGNNVNLEDFYNFISNKDNKSREVLNKIKSDLTTSGKGDNKQDDIVEWFLREFLMTPSKTFDLTFDIRMKLQDIIQNPYLKKFFTPGQNDKNLLDFSKSIDNGDAIFINTGSNGLGTLGKIFAESLMISYVNAAFSRKSTIPNVLYIDEYASYRPVTYELFIKGRSFKIAPVIAIQTRRQFDLLGLENTKEIGNIIENNLRNVFLLGGLSKYDVDYYADNFLIRDRGELIYLPFGNVCYRIVKNKSIKRCKYGKIYFIDQDID